MSRLPSSSSKYKISNPRPLTQDDPYGGYTPTPPQPSYNNTPQTSYTQQSSSYTPQYDYTPRVPSGPSIPERRHGESSSRGSGADQVQPQSSSQQTSPVRPARSRLRDPMQPGDSPGSSQPSRPARDLRPIRTQALNEARRPSATSDLHSPISPSGPQGGANGQGGMFSDPFAADKATRTEVMAQASAVQQQAQQPWRSPVVSTPGADKLRNVVGAFMTAGKGKEEPSAKRPARSDRRPKREPEEIWEVGNEGSGKFAEIDSVMRKIRKDWPFVLDSDFSPSTLALSLLSSSSSSSLPQHPGLSSFYKLHEALSGSLQSAVQAHFQSFAASLPAHTSFLATLSRAQEQVRKSQKELKDAREGFAGKGKTELAGVRVRERVVRDMLAMLDIIDNLKQIPEQLETLIGDKMFLQAALLLVRTLKTVKKPDLAEIGALADLRAYFTTQETTLSDILVEELHNHIYLKTFYSESRWRSYAPGQITLPVMEQTNPSLAPLRPDTATPVLSPSSQHGDASGRIPATISAAAALPDATSSRFSQYLTGLAAKPAHDPMLEYTDTDLVNAAQATKQRQSVQLSTAPSNMSLASIANGSAPRADARNPEADSFGYIEMLLEALAALGRLGAGLEQIAQRVPGEVHALVEQTLDEVEERMDQKKDEHDISGSPQSVLLGAQPSAPAPSANDLVSKRRSLFAPTDTLKIAVSLDVVGPARHAAVLKDLFWTMYSKLAAVLESHRVIYEVSRWISSRRDFKDASLSKANNTLQIPVLEVWKPMQQEVRRMIRSYLFDEAEGSPLDRRTLMTINEILRDGKVARDKQKPIFHFAETDAKTINKDIKLVDEAIQQALRASVPGLVGMQTAAEGVTQQVLTGSLAGSDDRFSSSAAHRTLIPPNTFNVTTLFRPTVAFIERAASIVPAGFEEETAPFSDALENFVVKVFLPQLDERVTASFQLAVGGYDAYQIDRKINSSTGKPPLKSAVRVMALIHSLCLMLNTTPFHRENYSRLVIGVIVQYYQQCSSRFKELVALPNKDVNSAEQPLALPAIWAQREDVIACLTELRTVSPTDKLEIANLGQREVKLEGGLLGDKLVVESQLIRSTRRLESLGNLLESLRWFIDSLLDLQAEAEEPLSPTAEDGETVVTEAMIRSPLLGSEEDDPKLPLTRAMSQRYEAIIQTYEQLAEMVLNTMRLEVRCRVLCNLGASLRKGDFRLETEALEPDPDVLDLGQELVDMEQIASQTLSDEDRSFIFRGLAHLVDDIFISSARNIKMVNGAGVKKIKRDILSLQQGLRNIGASPGDSSTEGTLVSSMSYWDLYERSPKEMLESLREGKPAFAFDDYNTMLNLQCGQDEGEGKSAELNTYLIDLHALSMSIEGWEIGAN